MKEAETIILPETGITEIVREKLKKGVIDNTATDDSSVPIIQFFETFDDCDITNPDCIISVFNNVFVFYCQEKKFGPLAPLLLEEEVYERNFIEIINLAFSISIDILNAHHPARLYSAYRREAGEWKVSEYPDTYYLYDSLSITKDELNIPPGTFHYDCVQQNLVFSMVYCLCENHQLNTDGSEIQQLLQYIYDSDDDVKVLIKEVFKQETPLWHTKQNTELSLTPPTLGETNADSEYEGEQTYYDTLSEEERDEKIKKAITKLKENGYLKQKDQYLGIFKVLVNRGVCTNNLSEFCRYMVILGFAKERTHGAATKRKTNDIYEVVKKVPSSFRDKRLSEWLSSREEQDAKFQKITDTAKRFSELIPSHKK